MIVDGNSIAEALVVSLKERCGTQPPRLAIIACDPTFATKRFLAIKEACAARIGVPLALEELPAESTTDDLIRAVKVRAADSDGVIVQLPLPAHIDTAAVLAALPQEKDVDGIGSDAVAALEGGDALVLPPVVGAIREIAQYYGVSFEGKRVAVVGDGRLVGRPAALWCRAQGASVTTLTKETPDIAAHLLEADILILGTGVPGLVTPEMVRDGVVIFDAGTSEEGGRLVGDADPACAEKASLFTPVPGGIGPVAVAVIFANVVELASRGRTASELL